MTDIGETPKPQETHLSPEQVARSDADLLTLSTLVSFASSTGSVLETTGGYATEAHFGGKITRHHGDMDAVLWLADPTIEQTAQIQVGQILSQEDTKWTKFSNEKDKEHFIEFKEEAPDRKFEDRRRLELYTFAGPSKRPLESKILIDSQGREYEVIVTTLEEIVADKVRIFNRTEEERTNKRTTTQTDIDDFNRLIKHPEFSKEKYLRTMSEYLVYKSGGSLTGEQALARAESMWEYAIGQTSHSQQGSL